MGRNDEAIAWLEGLAESMEIMESQHGAPKTEEVQDESEDSKRGS